MQLGSQKLRGSGYLALQPWFLSWVCLFQSSSYRCVIQVYKYKIQAILDRLDELQSGS